MTEGRGEVGAEVKLLNVFKKGNGEERAGRERKTVDLKELEIYSGMRVLVETPGEQILFIANLQDLRGGTASLCQCSDGAAALDEEKVPLTEHMRVRLRGYNDRERKAVLMEGVITPGERHVWLVEELTVIKVENERTFCRLDTDIDGVIGETDGDTAGERRCKLLNISVGGASITTEYRYHKGDRFLLKVRLLDKEVEMVLYCEVLRVAERSQSGFEYGCRFLELAGAARERISRSILAAQEQSAHGEEVL